MQHDSHRRIDRIFFAFATAAENRHTQFQPARTAETRGIRPSGWKVSSYAEPEAVSSDRRSPADLHPAVPPSGEIWRALCRTQSVSRSAFFPLRPSRQLRPDAASSPQARGRVARKSSGPSPRRISTTSTTSSALPIIRSQRLIHVRDERHHSALPIRSPVSTMSSARKAASFSVFMNAPEPVFTSSTSASMPSASFLLMMEAQIRYGLSTVPVTSRSA